MRARLDDTAREALQFLTLGTGLILLARLVYLGLVTYLHRWEPGTLEAAMAPFGNGYLIADGRTAVSGAIAPAGRLAVGALLTLLTGVVVALLSWGAARITGMPTGRTILLPTRTALLLTALWSLHATLQLPPVAAHGTPEGIRLEERRAFLGQVSLPGKPQRQFIPWQDIQAVTQRTVADPWAAHGERVQVVLHTAAESHVVGDIAPEGPDGSRARHEAQGAAQLLIASLSLMVQQVSGEAVGDRPR